MTRSAQAHAGKEELIGKVGEWLTIVPWLGPDKSGGVEEDSSIDLADAPLEAAVESKGAPFESEGGGV